MDEQGAPGQIQTQEGSLEKVEAGTENQGGIQRHCPSMQGHSGESQRPPGAGSGKRCQRQHVHR